MQIGIIDLTRSNKRVLTHELRYGNIVNMLDDELNPRFMHETITGIRNVGGDVVVSLKLENDMKWERIIPANDLYTQLWEVIA